MPDKQFGQLINVEPQSLIMLKTISAEFSFTEVWFTNQNNEQLKIKDSVNITLIIGPNKTSKVFAPLFYI